MSDTGEPARDTGQKAFLAWMEEERHRQETRRLRQQLQKLEKLQLSSYILILFWVMAMFVGYRLQSEWITAEIAGLVTIWIFFGGAFVVWHIIRLKRETERRLAHELEQVEERIES